MDRLVSAFRITSSPRGLVVALAIGAVALGAMFMAVVVPVLNSDATAQPSKPAPLWPSFTLTYAVWERDPRTGAVWLDQTRRISVVNEYDWRDEVLRDAVDPAAVGSYTEFRQGVLITYDAALDDRRVINDIEGTTATQFELTPQLYPRLRFGIGPDLGFAKTSATAPERLAWRRVSSVPCAPAPPRTERGPLVCRDAATPLEEEELVEFDAATAGTGSKGPRAYHGAIPVYGERRIGGEVVRRFEAISFRVESAR